MVTKLSLAVSDVVEFRRQWVNALNSGRFAQTTEELANDDYSAFCCLGVAEEVIGPTLPSPFTIVHASKANGYIYAAGEMTQEFCDMHEEYTDECDDECDIHYIDQYESLADSNLHAELRRALGLNRNQEAILISLNDNKVRFSVIADVINSMWIHLDGVVYSHTGYKMGEYSVPNEDLD